MNKTWTTEEVLEIYNRPLMQLVFDAAKKHREIISSRGASKHPVVYKNWGCEMAVTVLRQLATNDIDNNDLMSVSQVKAQALVKIAVLLDYVWVQLGKHSKQRRV